MTLSRNGQLLADYIVKSFQDDAVPTEPQLRERMAQLAPFLQTIGQGTTEAEQDDVLRELLARLRISMDVGAGLKADDLKPWLDSRRATIDPFYWTRFSNHLQKDWSPQVLRNFNKVTDSILD